ncbi:DUF2989 domain-containing protein [Shewanella sp.]|uniref:DUF2989 domain-containing protein n=1 Tax=Shewanella sp. TaxID=50422 RepID=UPI003A973681
MQRYLGLITSFCFISLLQGCDRLSPTERICKNNPEICEDLHTDGWCKVERANLVSNRLAVKSAQEQQQEQQQDKLLYNLLLNLEAYNKCIGLAAGVQHVNNPIRTSVRARAYGLSSQSLAELQASVSDAKTPYLSFYQWTHRSNEQGLHRLLEAEKQGQISDPQILTALAVHYLKVQPEKALSLYIAALEQVSPEQFQPDWLLGTATAFHYLGYAEERYLFEKANLLLTGRNANQQQMSASVGGNPALVKQLDEQAEDLVDTIKDGDFRSSRWAEKFRAIVAQSAASSSHSK